MTTNKGAFERSALSRKVALVGAILDNFVQQESCATIMYFSLSTYANQQLAGENDVSCSE